MKPHTTILVVCLLSASLMVGALGSPPKDAGAQSGGATQRISLGLYSEEANGGSSFPAISANSRFVAFASNATNLVLGDNNGRDDIFVYDRAMRSLSRVSVASDGSEANGHSYAPAISADGRFVAFASYATNLVSGDTNNWVDVFVRDRELGKTVRVSVASDGSQGQYGGSNDPAISADGRFVAFWSCATNLVASDTNSACDIFVHDRDTDGNGVFDESGKVSTVRVSVASDGTQANGDSYYPDISADGRFVVFESGADNLVTGDTNSQTDIFLHDRDADEDGVFDEPGGISTIRISVASDGTEGNGNSTSASISADGRYVAFASSATNLVSSDTNGYADIFLRDWRGGTTTRISVSSSGSEGDGFSEAPSISFNGRFIAFVSNAYDLDSTCSYAARHVFVRDRSTNQTACVSIASDGTEAYGDSWNPSVSADGHYVAFGSDASNLVSGDTNNQRDIFVRDRQVRSPVAMTIPTSGGLLAASGIVLDFPPNTFTDTAVVTCTARASENAPSPGSDLTGIDRFFDIEAVYEATGLPAQPASGKSYTITISYNDEEKGPAIESTLALYYWTGSQWTKEAGSVVDAADNTVTAPLSHLSLFAVLGETRRVYLPVTLKNP